jgi:hypothetical protein
MDETTAPASPHELLLRLAGRVDDDLLADARELVAVGEDGHALELLTAALTADGTALPAPVRAELVASARAARIDLDAETALAPAAPDTTAHRFASTAGADVAVVAATRELPGRLTDGIRLRLAWRQTPAGSAAVSGAARGNLGGRAARRGARVPGGGGVDAVGRARRGRGADVGQATDRLSCRGPARLHSA